MGDVREILDKKNKNRQRLEKDADFIFTGFDGLLNEYYKPGTIDLKHKELIEVALSVADRCVPGLANHMNKAVNAGATREEIIEAAALGVEFGGGPSFIMVRSNLLTFLDEILENKDE